MNHHPTCICNYCTCYYLVPSIFYLHMYKTSYTSRLVEAQISMTRWLDCDKWSWKNTSSQRTTCSPIANKLWRNADRNNAGQSLLSEWQLFVHRRCHGLLPCVLERTKCCLAGLVRKKRKSCSQIVGPHLSHHSVWHDHPPDKLYFISNKPL